MRLVDDWREAWKWASVRLAFVFGLFGAGAVGAWPVFQWAVDSYLPTGPWRAVCAVGAFVVMFGVPVFARVTQKSDAADQ